MNLKRKQLFLLLGIIVFFAGCSTPSIPRDKLQVNYSSNFVKGADGKFDSVCVEESGIFYITDGSPLLRYCDYETGQKYVLCSQVGCKHTGPNCLAWFGDYDCITGYAYYQGRVYLLRQKSYNMDWELISIDMEHGTEKNITTIVWDEDGLCPYSIHDIYYGENHVWMCVDYYNMMPGKEKSVSQLLAIDLSDGRKQELTKLEDHHTLMSIKASGDGYIIYTTQLPPEPPLSRVEYLQQFGKDADYMQYKREYLEIADTTGAAYAYSTVDGMISTLWKGVLSTLSPSGESYGYPRIPYEYVEIYNGQLIYYPVTEDGTVSLCSYDLVTKEHQQFFLFEDGSLVEYSLRGAVKNPILYYYIYGEDGCRIIRSFNLETRADKKLFTDTHSGSFNIMAETSNKLILSIRDDDSQRGNIFWVYKEDFESGNLDDAKKMLSLWMGLMT